MGEEHLYNIWWFFLSYCVIAGETWKPFEHKDNDEVEDCNKDGCALDNCSRQSIEAKPGLTVRLAVWKIEFNCLSTKYTISKLISYVD